MTEFEINKAVAEKDGLCVADYFKSLTSDYTGSEIDVSDKHGDYHTYSFDPCNNIEQAWEIMMKYNICVTKDEEIFEAYSSLVIDNYWVAGASGIAYHQKPLVAAMLCFLEM